MKLAAFVQSVQGERELERKRAQAFSAFNGVCTGSNDLLPACGEIDAAHVLHREHTGVFVDEELVQVDQVRMHDAAQRTKLVLETESIAGAEPMQDLEGDV